jgi:hypothetical protein
VYCFEAEHLDNEGHFDFLISANQKLLPVWGASTGHQYGLSVLKVANTIGHACSYIFQVVDSVKEGSSNSTILAYREFLCDTLIAGPLSKVFAGKVSKSFYARHTCQNAPLAFKADFSYKNVSHKAV